MHDKNSRLPGEAAFSLLLAALSVALLWKAYGISGVGGLSAPGTFPMAVATIMVLTSGAIAFRTVRLPASREVRTWKGILPRNVVLMAGLVGLYAAALQPLGFLPTSFLFLLLAIRILTGSGWWRALWVSIVALTLIYIVFRLIFLVLMPEGIVPEREILAAIGRLWAGGDE